MSTTTAVIRAEDRVLEAARDYAEAAAAYEDLARRNASVGDCRFSLAERERAATALADAAAGLRAADEVKTAFDAALEAQLQVVFGGAA